MPRGQRGAVITDPDVVAANALKLAREGTMFTGERITVDTLCLLGDNPMAVANARAVRAELEEAG